MKTVAILLAVLGLAGCGERKATPHHPVPVSSPIWTPAMAYGVAQPHQDCTTDGANFGPGWKVWVIDHMDNSTTAIDWDYDVADWMQEMKDSPLGVTPAWYCPPKG